MNSESHLSASRTSSFTLFGPHSLYLQGISIPLQERFQNRYIISLKRKTHCSQKPPTALEAAIKKFHSSLLRLRNTGNFKASDLANMDQTLLPFVLDDGKTYDKKGAKEVWAQSGQSGQDKRQPTFQLTVTAPENRSLRK